MAHLYFYKPSPIHRDARFVLTRDVKDYRKRFGTPMYKRALYLSRLTHKPVYILSDIDINKKTGNLECRFLDYFSPNLTYYETEISEL